MPVYTVKQGDTLSSIALSHGISSWQALYNDPSNSAFRLKRPNPNRIVPGDQINIPALGPVADFSMAIIDGTGSGNRHKYDEEMRDSFCKQLADGIGMERAKYFRGPGLLGFSVGSEASDAYEYLKNAHVDAVRNEVRIRLMLAGYSRGGSAVIKAAERLQKDGINVEAMFLFDAVARHGFRGGEKIPANVRFSRHARRRLDTTFVTEYEGTLADSAVLPNASNPTRPTFGNTGLTWDGDGNHEIATPFVGSHGALGGVGWSFVTEDFQCQRDVATWMNSHLKEHRVWHQLCSKSLAIRPIANPNKAFLKGGLAFNARLLEQHEKNLAQAGRIR